MLLSSIVIACTILRTPTFKVALGSTTTLGLLTEGLPAWVMECLAWQMKKHAHESAAATEVAQGSSDTQQPVPAPTHPATPPDSGNDPDDTLDDLDSASQVTPVERSLVAEANELTRHSEHSSAEDDTTTAQQVNRCRLIYQKLLCQMSHDGCLPFALAPIAWLPGSQL